MYQEFYRGSQLLHLPLVALVIFLGVFVGTFLWLFVIQRKSTRFETLALLPLEGDAPTAEARNDV